MPTIYKSNWAERAIKSVFGIEDEEPGWEQLPLPLVHTLCEHQWYDDGRNLRIVCSKCGVSRSVSFTDPWDGKTYQEIFELMQENAHLVK